MAQTVSRRSKAARKDSLYLTLGMSLLLSTSAAFAATVEEPVDPLGLNEFNLGSARPFIWTEAEGFVGLGRLPEGMTVELDNSVGTNGTVVGTASNTRRSVAFVWDQRQGVQLLEAEPGTNSGALAINGMGTILGWETSGETRQAVIWEDGAPRLLSQSAELPENVVLEEALGFGPNGEVVVLVRLNGSEEPQVAIWTKDNPLEFLPNVDGATPTSVSDISSKGHVVGRLPGATPGQAYLWHPAEGGRALPPLAPGSDVQVLGVNAAGQAVGTETGENPIALLWAENGTPTNLNETIIDQASHGIHLLRADSINDDGEIVAYGRAVDDSIHLIKLVPVEPPEDEAEAGNEQSPQFRLQDLGQIYLQEKDQPLAFLYLSNSGTIVGSCAPLARVCQMPGSDVFALDRDITNFFLLGNGDNFLPLLSDGFLDGGGASGAAIGTVASSSSGNGGGTNNTLTTTPQGGTGSAGSFPFSGGGLLLGGGGAGGSQSGGGTTDPSPVPLPGSLGLLASAAALLWGTRRKRTVSR